MRTPHAAVFVGILAGTLVLAFQGSALADQRVPASIPAFATATGNVGIESAAASVTTVSKRGYRGKYSRRGGGPWRGWRGRGWYGYWGGYRGPWSYGGVYPRYDWNRRGIKLMCYDDIWGETICERVPRRRY